MDTFAQHRVVFDQFQNLQQSSIHLGISLMYFTGENIACVVVDENLSKRVWPLKCHVWAFIVGKSSLEIKHQRVLWNFNRVAILIFATSQHSIEFGASKFLQWADVGGGQCIDMLFELIGRQAKFVNNFAFIIRLQNLRQHPRFEVDAVCDSVKLDFVVVAITKICHARVQFTNAIFGFGELDG